MKILLLNLLMNVSLHTSDTEATEDYTWVLDELNAEQTELVASQDLESMVNVFDADGNLVKEILKADYDENNMTTSEYKTLSKSAFMFDYLGDSYFLLED